MKTRKNLAALATLAMVLGGCASNVPRRETQAAAPVEPGPTAARPAGPPQPAPVVPFYDQDGTRYHVLSSSSGYLERGVASWYGSDFHGRRTSSGEPYDMYAMTAAHKTLPLPTRARVTNLTNGRTIVVRINDRGPFKKDRLIDLSYAAARELGVVGPGTALVEVQAIEQDGMASLASPAAAPAGRLYVQVGAFSELGNAERLKKRLTANGFANIVIRYDARDQPARYRVRLGPIADSQEYDAIVRRVAQLDVQGHQLVVESGDPAWNLPAADEHGMPGG